MGNRLSSSNNNTTYEPLINNINIESENETKNENKYLKSIILNLQSKNENIEIRMSKIDQMMQNKYEDIYSSINIINERITIMTKDLESLLNNDKLLLDKLIEKNIVSTIQEQEYSENQEDLEDNEEEHL